MMDAQTNIELQRRLDDQSYRDSRRQGAGGGPDAARAGAPLVSQSGLLLAAGGPVQRHDRAADPLPIRGAIWYQGESNAGPERAALYARLFPDHDSGLGRRAWGQGEFPFLFVQIANWKTAPDAMWPTVRDAQRRRSNWSTPGWRDHRHRRGH